MERWPDDEALFALFLEVHRRRDKIALHMLPLDQHLHCPTFATLRVSSLTYPGTMGELLHGEVCTIGDIECCGGPWYESSCGINICNC